MKKLVFSLMLLSLFSCGDDDDNSSDTTDEENMEENIVDDGNTDIVEGVNISSVVQQFFKDDNGVTVEVNEDTETITITSATGLPDHKTPYFDVNGQDHELYEDFPAYTITESIQSSFIDLLDAMVSDRIVDGDVITYAANNNDAISEVSYVMEIPMIPTEAEVKQDTELSAIGMALNGVPYFNDLNRDSNPLGPADVSTLDAAGGHPGANEDYHYHLGANPGINTEEDPEIPYATVVDQDNLVGFMRDGFPLYGLTEEDGSSPELDEFGGHMGSTEHFPDGIYHYHAQSEDFLGSGWHILKSGQYFGTPGSFE